MTITYTEGDILMDPAEAIVIPVNTVGVLGAGLAKAWAKKDPAAASLYKVFCEMKLIKVGEVSIIKFGEPITWVLFPTKQHWRQSSRLEWIELGLIHLAENVPGLKSLAIPALGCGLGSLQWEDVKQLIEKYLSPLDIPITVYPPK